MNDLTTKLEQLAISAQAHYAEAEAHLAGFVEEVLALCDDLLRGRELCGSNDNMFNAWLKKAGLDHISHQDRAAYIGMAKNREVSAKELAVTTRSSPQLIWRDIRSKMGFTSASKPPTEPPITRREDTVRPRVLMSPPPEEHSM